MMHTSQYRSVMISFTETQLSTNSSPVKLFSHKRWKNLIIGAAENLKNQFPAHLLLITDLQTIGKAIPEEYLIEATIGIKKFKPQFEEQKPFLETTTVSTLSQTCIKAAKYKTSKSCCDGSSSRCSSVREKNFHREFSKKSHPFRFMIKNIRNLLQLKYKSLIDRKKLKMSELQQSLKKDVQICMQFLKYTAQPYKELFDHKDEEQNQKLCEKFDNFFKCYINNHPKIHQTVHKIVLYFSRQKYRELLEEKLPNSSSPQEYSIPQDFQIDGCYIRSMTSLIEFANYSSQIVPSKIMAKLLEFRKNILNDIDEFYLQRQGDSKQLQLNAEIQIEVIRFIICKLKGWGVQIFTQLKFLEYVYGEDDIAFKYEEASFMYAQLSMAFQLIGFE